MTRPCSLLTFVITVPIKPITQYSSYRTKDERCRSILDNDTQCQDGTASTAMVSDPAATCDGKLISRYMGRRCHCRSTSLATTSLAALRNPKVGLLLDELHCSWRCHATSAVPYLIFVHTYRHRQNADDRDAYTGTANLARTARTSEGRCGGSIVRIEIYMSSTIAARESSSKSSSNQHTPSAQISSSRTTQVPLVISQPCTTASTPSPCLRSRARTGSPPWSSASLVWPS
jgi:hypothetical protein